MSDSEKTLGSVMDVLNAAKAKDATYASNFWVPSLKREIRMKEMNTSQQKRLIKSIIDSPVFNTEFVFTMYEILKENCIDVDVNELTVIDKLLLALAMRITCVNNIMTAEVKTADGTEVNVDIDLKNVYDIAKASLSDIEPKIVRDAEYVVVCSVPTIGTEYMVEKEMRKDVDKVTVDTPKQLRKVIESAFIDEIVKYVSKVSMVDGEVETPIDWKKFNYTDRIRVIETFKMGLLKQILEYINTVKAEVEKIEIVNFEVKGEKFVQRLEIDGNFFMVS